MAEPRQVPTIFPLPRVPARGASAEDLRAWAEQFSDSLGEMYRLLTKGPMQAYTVTNLTTDRTYDADTALLAEVADVLGTLIADLRARGIVG